MKTAIFTVAGAIIGVVAMLEYCYVNLIMGVGWTCAIWMVIFAALAGGTLGYTATKYGYQ